MSYGMNVEVKQELCLFCLAESQLFGAYLGAYTSTNHNKVAVATRSRLRAVMAMASRPGTASPSP